MSITVDTSQITKFASQLNDLAGKNALKVIAISLNEAATHGRTVANKGIREVYNLKAGDISETLSTRTANRGSLEAQVRAKSTMTPMVKFSPSPAGPQHTNQPKPWSIEVVKGHRKTFKGGFVAAVGTGGAAYNALGRKGGKGINKAGIRRDILRAGGTHLGFWERKGKSRHPIRQEYSVGTAQMMLAKRLNNRVPNESADYYQKRLGQNLFAALSGYIK